jgi:hypothetical protein
MVSMRNPKAIRRAIVRFHLRVLRVEATLEGDTLLTLARKESGSRIGSMWRRTWRNWREAVVDGDAFSSLYNDGLLKEHQVAVELGWIRPDVVEES